MQPYWAVFMPNLEKLEAFRVCSRPSTKMKGQKFKTFSRQLKLLLAERLLPPPSFRFFRPLPLLRRKA